MIRKFFRPVIALLLVCLLMFTIGMPALAYEARGDTNVTVASNEVVDNDLYVAGTTITIDGTVNGDVFAMGRTIVINGTINGGITIAGQTITVNGTVSRGARLAGQTITLSGNIGGDLLAASSDVIINQPAVIGRDLVLGCSAALIGGHVAGNVIGGAQEVMISNQIDGFVRLDVNTLTITSTANIAGDVTYTSSNQAVIQEGAVVSGQVNQIIPAEPAPRPERGFWAGVLSGIIFKIISFIAIFIIGLILILFARRNMKLLALSLKYQPVMSLAWGALLFFITPIVAFIIMFTLIGIPLALIMLVVWGIFLYLSQIPVALIIGWLILSRGRETNSIGFLLGALALGLFILYLVTLIPIVGWILWLFVMIFGLGTLVTVFRTSAQLRAPTETEIR
jgi:cytoskeletal protein CcmA (bactofilin family)